MHAAIALDARRLLFLGLFACSQVVSNVAYGEDSCAKAYKDVPGKTSLGTASTWANLRGADGSLKAESKKLLDQATKERATIKPPADACPTGCEVAPNPLLIFSSVPNKLLKDYSDSATCEKLAAQTKTAPFRYDAKSFSSLDDLNAWFSDFSQGKGKDGNDLYEKCPGSCSPQYTNIIDLKGARFILTAQAVCGGARDKDDNQYRLSVAYRYQCKAKS